MPYVNIRVAGSLTEEQKANICRGVTDIIVKEAKKPPESVLVFIDEVPPGNIAKKGKLLTSTK